MPTMNDPGRPVATLSAGSFVVTKARLGCLDPQKLFRALENKARAGSGRPVHLFAQMPDINRIEGVMFMRGKQILILLIGLFSLVGGCKRQFDAGEHPSAKPLDYSKAECWANKPEDIQHAVDVFYVFPTIYDETQPLNMDIMNRPDLQARARGLMAAQAGVYSSAANLFAPLYRQTSFAALNPDEDMYKNRYFRIGADDVAQAFDYYLEHDNQGRPFILASHSQGTLVMMDLMRKKLGDPALREKLVAAYLIGYSVMPEDFANYPWIKPATGADDTGVVISYNTETPGATGSPVLKKGAFCINPLNWKTDATPAGRHMNLGAVFFDDFAGTLKKEIPHYAGARVNPQTGALETVPPDYENLELGHFPPGVLHKFDYAFWFRNLEENVARRIEAYQASH